MSPVEILEKNKINKTLPIDLNIILKKEAITLYSADFSRMNLKTEISGYVKKDENGTVIVINRNDSAERKRFTIAHELGHYYLHFNKLNSFKKVELRKSNTNDPKEIEADRFAAELLMPENLLRIEYEKQPFLKSSLELSKKFFVSVAAMRYRLDLVGLRYHD